MRSLSEFEKVFIHRGPVDMRKSTNGLSQIVQDQMGKNLMEPHLFVFSNRRRDLLKILYFDLSGFALWIKRLEKERFPWCPRRMTEDVVELTPEQLKWLLSGIDIWKHKPFERLNFSRVS